MSYYMSEDEAVSKLKSVLIEWSKLQQYKYGGDNSEFDKLLRKTSRLVNRIFGEKSVTCNIKWHIFSRIIWHHKNFCMV